MTSEASSTDLKCVVELDDEGELDVRQDVAFHLGADAVPDLQRGLSQHLHGVQRPGVLQQGKGFILVASVVIKAVTKVTIVVPLS